MRLLGPSKPDAAGIHQRKPFHVQSELFLGRYSRIYPSSSLASFRRGRMIQFP